MFKISLVIPQRVFVKWNATSKNHYIDKGYIFTKIGDLFEVDVCDLSLGSSVPIKIACDFCGEIYEKPWKDYLNLKSEKYCCPICMTHKKKTKDKNGKLIFVEIPYRNKKWLYEEYIVKNRLADDIANECDIHPRTLREWISTFDLNHKKEDYTNSYSELTKEVLYELYRVQHKSSSEIARMYGITDGTVLNRMEQYGIPPYSLSEALRIYYREKGGLEKARKMQSTYENRVKSSCRQHGILIKDFKGFSTSEQHIARNNSLYHEWRKQVFKRDNYTCQACNKRGGNLNAHHLKNFSTNIDLRYDVDNGITLCEECHLINYQDSFHSIYGEKDNTPEQIYEFIQFKNSTTISQ